MNIVLFDVPEIRIALKPFSFTRPLSKIRIGITTIEEKWHHFLKGSYSHLTAPYLGHKFPGLELNDTLYINGTICPDASLIPAINQLSLNEALVQGSTLIALRGNKKLFKKNYLSKLNESELNCVAYKGKITQIKNRWDIFLLNSQEIFKDFEWISAKMTTQPIQDNHTRTYNASNIFIEAGAQIKAAILNAEKGPIYIGKNAIIHEGAIIKGPVSIGEGVQVNMGARLHQGTTIGPYSKVGGEINNSVIFGHSNKAHEGFMGNAVVGEWCNIGASTNGSNLRNDYDEIKVWDYAKEAFVGTKLQFCGFFMGDYSKCSINTMINTGSTIGVNVNLFGQGLCDKFIPSFTWGGAGIHTTTYGLNKALEVAERSMKRRKKMLTKEDREILSHIFRITTIQRIKAMM